MLRLFGIADWYLRLLYRFRFWTAAIFGRLGIFQLSAGHSAHELPRIVLLLAIPTVAMGATIAVFAVIAEDFNLPVSRLYAANVAGATAGVLVTTFFLIPPIGFLAATAVICCVNLLIAISLFLVSKPQQLHRLMHAPDLDSGVSIRDHEQSFLIACLIVACTGFATFTLEVAWFRSLRAAFHTTHESFAIMLASVLLSLYVGALVFPFLKRVKRVSVAYVLALAGLTIFVSTPLVERMDIFVGSTNWPNYHFFTLGRFGYALLILGMPMLLTGIALPWLLDSYKSTRSVSVLYEVNTAGAVMGSLLAAWVFYLPWAL